MFRGSSFSDNPENFTEDRKGETKNDKQERKANTLAQRIKRIPGYHQRSDGR
jgi:hypothetical protein